MYSFPKTARLLDKAQYQAVFSSQQKISNDIITVFVLKNQHDMARLGLAISRKCTRQATKRNRIKRVIRETFRMTRHNLPAFDFVVTCKPAAVATTNVTLKTSFLTQLDKICQQYAN